MKSNYPVSGVRFRAARVRAPRIVASSRNISSMNDHDARMATESRGNQSTRAAFDNGVRDPVALR